MRYITNVTGCNRLPIDPAACVRTNVRKKEEARGISWARVVAIDEGLLAMIGIARMSPEDRVTIKKEF